MGNKTTDIRWLDVAPDAVGARMRAEVEASLPDFLHVDVVVTPHEEGRVPADAWAELPGVGRVARFCFGIWGLGAAEPVLDDGGIRALVYRGGRPPAIPIYLPWESIIGVGVHGERPRGAVQ